MHRASRVLAAAVLSAAVTLACSDGGSVTDPHAPMGLALSLSPSADTIYVADTLTDRDTVQLALRATSLGLQVKEALGAEWTSSDPGVAVVDSAGGVHARGVGTATITARVNDERATATVVVARRAITVQLSPSAVTGLAGDTVVVTASALDAGGALVPGTQYAFGVSDATIARVERTGNQTARVIFLKAGTTQVWVAAAGQTANSATTALAREFVAPAAGSSSGALTLSAGLNTTCGLLPLNRAYCFGSAPTIGVARDTSCFNNDGRPPIPCTLVPLRIAGDLSLKQVAVGDSVACGVTSDNRAYCWGSQTFGQVGNGVSSPGTAVEPALVIGAVFRNAVPLTQVTAGGVHACGLTPAGKADCWGQDSTLQLGDALIVNSTTPIPVNDAFTFTAISAGRRHTCALQADGVAFCWGSNRFGQLGRSTVGGDLPLLSASDAVAGGAIRFTAISAGATHTCGLSTDRTVYCWGSNAEGELGRGTAGVASGTPQAVAGGGSYSVVDAGTSFTCAVTTSGAAFCWGINDYGQIGNGPGNGEASGSKATSPTAVIDGHTFAAITAGERHACAIATDASAQGAYCWGSNILGSLGNELQAAVRSAPQKVAMPRD